MKAGANCHQARRLISASMGQVRLRETLRKKEGAGIAQTRALPQRRCHNKKSLLPNRWGKTMGWERGKWWHC